MRFCSHTLKLTPTNFFKPAANLNPVFWGIGWPHFRFERVFWILWTLAVKG